MLVGAYDSSLVLISLLVAILASYTALDLAGRIGSAKHSARRYWIAGGALAMGFGVWSMHFIGMLAFSLPLPLGYDLTLTLASLVLSVLASGFALWFASQPEMPFRRVLFGGLAMGAGISAMHYLGMHALLMLPGIVYDPLLVCLSLVVAALASAAALRIAFSLRAHSPYVRVARGAASLVMGLAIVGMHYIGMAAAGFPEGSLCGAANTGLDTQWLASLVIVSTLAVLGIALLVSVLDARLDLKTDALSYSLAQANQELRELALQDSLTKLPNRLLLEDRMDQHMQRAKRGNGNFVLMFMDLDGFKPINDAFGHHVGDQLLCAVAERLRTHVRAQDTLARVGGDEFVLLADVASRDDATIIAELLAALINRPFEVGEHELRVSTSIGVALYPGDGMTQQDLLMSADAAMYHAKNNGKNDFCFFEPAMTVDARSQLNLLLDLRAGLERSELRVYYQPKLDVLTNQTIGAEALVRWEHPELGLLAPDRFVGLAEKAGLIASIDEWVLRAAGRQLKQWREQGFVNWRVAVNVSALHLRHHWLVEVVQEVLRENELPAQCLTLEITETMAVSDRDSIAMLERLAATGVDLSVDDFGSGYSSLAYLKRLPVNELKIDRSFVREIEHGNVDAAIVASIVTLGRAMQLRVVAEGVENAEQQALLAELGCDVLQGYWLGKPMPADLFLRHVAAATATCC